MAGVKTRRPDPYTPRWWIETILGLSLAVVPFLIVLALMIFSAFAPPVE